METIFWLLSFVLLVTFFFIRLPDEEYNTRMDAGLLRYMRCIDSKVI